VRVAAQVALAKSDKTSDLQNGVWSKVVGLKPVEEEKPTKEFVGRERQTAEEKRGEEDAEAYRRSRHHLVARDAGVIVGGEVTRVAKGGEIALLRHARLPDLGGRGGSLLAGSRGTGLPSHCDGAESRKQRKMALRSKL
jgi:hypothetical protein